MLLPVLCICGYSAHHIRYSPSGLSLHGQRNLTGEGVKPPMVGVVTGGGEALHSGRSEEDQSKSGEESSKSRKEKLALAPLIRVCPPHGKQRLLAVAQSKWWVSPSPKVGLSKKLQGDALLVDPLRPHVFSPILAHLQPSPQETVKESMLALNVDLR
ncbi:hypothetical protein C0993_009578 [Termitomyces sp. T159_Od127]|nr:hypothetical protein C0993_009578 [Termitomyces sp. T159_Od127]